MKGIVHFTVGATIATFFKDVMHNIVTAASPAAGLPLIIGGVYGFLPDFVDFRFAKYMMKYDYVIDPDPENPDPKEIAETIAKAIDEAYEKKKSIFMQLHTIPITSNLWRRYTVKFDTENKKVIVTIGPIVTTGKIPYEGTEPPNNVAEASFKADVIHTYEEETKIDILSGPSFEFRPEKDKVKIIFLPFHRRWSHSFPAAFLMALPMLLFNINWFWIAFLAYVFHIILDMLGYMGSNLFWPFTKSRVRGLRLGHSDNAMLNFSSMWICVALTLWNVNEALTEKVFSVPFITYISYTTVLPLLIIGLISLAVYLREKREKETPEEAEVKEALSEDLGPYT